VIGKISVIILMPVIAVIIMMLSVIILSKRENIIEYNNSLENIESVEKIK
jgi:sensor domain CHASE-containing protein